MIKNRVWLLMTGLCLLACGKQKTMPQPEPAHYGEKHRPQIHFTPKENWMNDPNGLVYYNDAYHLFYQHYPKEAVWGPMHWGHALSKDLIHWKHLPIALYPDSLGMIFSGSAVVDKENSSLLGVNASAPLVAIFTYHNAAMEKAGRNDYQTQGMAFSLDSGKTWTKYDRNPVVTNPGEKDFRDPKVFWHKDSKKWILTLVAGDHAEFYASNDLKQWAKLSEFGKDYGTHGGVWECPDLFPLTVEGESAQKWILIVNINPGGPNGGSATQYFIGDFDGTTFKCDTDRSKVSWIDYGPDDYAGITWSNAPDNRTIFIGWMSNWAYAQAVPTSPWRSANTIPRELKLIRSNNELHVASVVVPELSQLEEENRSFGILELRDSINLTKEMKPNMVTSRWTGSLEAKDWRFVFSNSMGQRVTVGFEKESNRFFLDRTMSGDTTFSKDFSKICYAPRIATIGAIGFDMVVDVSSVEVFFDNGLTVMTGLFFPETPFDQVTVYAGDEPVSADKLVGRSLKSIWHE